MSKANQDPSTHLLYILSALSKTDTFAVDWNEVASDNNIGYARNAQSKFRDILKKYGYTLENNKIIRLDDSSASPQTPRTPRISRAVKTPTTPRSIKKTIGVSTATPSKAAVGFKDMSPSKKGRNKKRKLSEAEDGEEDSDHKESENVGEVKDETEADDDDDETEAQD